VALTATASPPVRADISGALGLRDPRVVVAGLDRPNLHLAALACTSDEQRWQRLVAWAREQEPPGVVYAPTRAVAEELADRLSRAGIEATAFHAGLATAARHRRYEDFMADRIPVMVATSAFGMGVDKPNIRWVCHVALPDSPDSYLQEIGRAGRDGQPAGTLLLFRPEDMALQRYFAAGAPPRADLVALALTLREGSTSRKALAERTGLVPRKLSQLLTLLEEVGAVTIGPHGALTVPRFAPPAAEAAEQALAAVERQRILRHSRIDMMRQYAETRRCRGRALLGYFGEQFDRECGHCDNCAAPGPDGPGPRSTGSEATGATREGRPSQTTKGPRRQTVQAPTAGTARRPALAEAGASITAPDAVADGDRPFPVSGAVRHPEWGTGTVLAYEKDRVVVLFDTVGYKTLSVRIAHQRGLLTVDGTP